MERKVIKNLSLKDRSSGRHFKYYGIFLLVCLLILVVRLGWLQLYESQHWAEKARDQLQESRILQTPRGAIFDRSGKEMAISHMAKSLFADPREIKEPEILARKLSVLLDLPEKELLDRLKAKRAFMWLKRTLEPQEFEKVSAFISKEKVKGLHFQEESRRVYPNEQLAAHVLGFVGIDDKGLNGLEMAMDKTIRGQTHRQILDTDSQGTPIFKSIYAFTKPKGGHSIYLTIDSAIQFAVEQVLDRAMERTKAQAATMIVMNPKTGEILAMANRPGYNPNRFWSYPDKIWRNRAVSGVYEPGSTFKPMVAAAGFQENLVNPTQTFNDTGALDVGGRVIKNWDGGRHGRISFADVFKMSLNTGFAEVAQRMGGERMLRYAREFGFGKATGVELPGEEEGILLSLRSMQPSDVATMGIGQAIAVTPLQLLTAIGALANDGLLVKPQIVKEIRDSDGLLVSYSNPQTVRQVVRPEVAAQIVGLMEKVVTEGGGKRARVEGYRFAGKTGTAERMREDGAGYESGRYIASFAGFGPLEDIQLAALIVIDSPQGLFYGGEIAAPVFAEAMTQIVRILGIRPSQQLPAFQPPKPAQPKPQGTTPSAPAKPAPAQPGPPGRPSQPLPPGSILMPDVRGLTIRQAATVLNKAGLSMIPEGSGIAVRQSIMPNAPVARGSEVTIYFEQR